MWPTLRDIWLGLQLAWKDPFFHLVITVGVVCLIALAGFSSSSRGADTEDRWGFAVPPDCRKDMSWIPVKIHTIDLIEKFGVPMVRGLPGRRVGLWEYDNGVHNIYIDIKVPSHLRKEVIDHERCHALWYIKYGHPDWHGREEGD
jgi:hypothetical protein